ncbi:MULTISPECIES: polymorphic toxin-type HINT domain-containing protein [Streptomyces]|uniref:Polymorphic toxin-type HINT domain-containing protein n=1 Tax=Streptomyces solicathayae TaxID=3081768 RepID=A0ABZ0LSS0_9ACTN|nr:polymorphic toxin-type HINT domain-containing protein [Streptomyces sp. HUAS YS2]WOX22340.1 polymorphic toxin-type HINT domain-containing protein [Streptomyces sp. HUAS YS2]
MSLSRGTYTVRRRLRALMPRTKGRLLGLRKSQSGQGALEYVGLIVIVVAIVGALLATNMGPELAGSLKTSVCKVTGGDNCGGGAGDQAAGPDGKGDQPAGDGNDQPKSQAQIDYDNALKELQDAQNDEKSAGDKAKDAAKELAKILAEELGITDAFNCITKGDMGACTETLINILTSLIGGAIGKLAAKYGAPWKWKKAAELIGKLKKHGGDLYDGITDLIKNRKRVKDAQKKVDDAKAKVDGEKNKPDEKKPDDKPTDCPVGHSFLPGTRVLVAGGLSVPIESVRLGDEVLATDPVTGLTSLRTVSRIFTTYDDKDFTRLTTSAGTVTATDTHPFWLVDEKRWADAGDIEAGDLLRQASGDTLTVRSVERYTQRQTTHDLTVNDVHSYYVGMGTRFALVHNNDPCDNPDYDDDPNYGITDDAHEKIRKAHGTDIADGVDYNVQRIKSKDQAPPNETPEAKAKRLKNADDHIIPGTNGDPTKMADYFASFKNKQFTHHDARPPDPSRPTSQADVLYDKDRGCVIIKNGTMIHGYKMSEDEFNRLYTPGALRN